MRIAFYAPLKAPHHPVPSGDRQMARLLIEALEQSGHSVETVSDLRAYCATPDDAHYAALSIKADAEIQRLRTLWSQVRAPDLWFTYHPYYKAPDLLGPRLAKEAGIPYVTAEASHSKRRDEGVWRQTQDSIVEAVRGAAANLCFTERDRRGLEIAAPDARLLRFSPFIKPVILPRERHREVPRLVTVAMMRAGDKLESYRMLAASLTRLMHRQWVLTVVGCGAAEPGVREALDGIAAERIHWLGEVEPEEVPFLLSRADIYVWPGYGEAYGLAYLEAGAAALPVVAQRVAGVPEVVREGETALLTEPGDVDAFAAAIDRLLRDAELRESMGRRGRAFVTGERSLNAAAGRLSAVLSEVAVA